MNFKRVLVTATALGLATVVGSAVAQTSNTQYSERDVRGTWTYSGWVEATLLIPFPAEITHSAPPSSIVGPGEKVTVKGALVGLFHFDGKGTITQFNDLFKAGGLEPVPFPFAPPAPEQGHGSYTVAPDGTVKLSTLIINPIDDSVAGEADYDCVLIRSPRQLDCIISRFKTFVVDPAGYDAPVVGQFVLRPQR
jgi:hypothetical protein